MSSSPTVLEPVIASRGISWQFAPRVAVSAVVVGLLTAGIWFRIVDLDHTPGLNGDEAWSGVQAVKFLRGESISWRTPTGNPLNVFFWGPLVALHRVFQPSIALLRSVSVASGLLALAANYWLCRRLFDHTTALVSTVLLAVLPVTIAYSRFAWDSSQTPLASLLVVYVAIAIANGERTWSNWLWLTVVLLAAIWIHPTNVFLAPLVIACITPRTRLRVTAQQRIVAIIVAIMVIFVVRSTAEVAGFTLGLSRLFCGTTVYRFISGGIYTSAIDWSDVLTWCVAGWALVGFIKRIEATNDDTDRRLAVGLTLSLGAFFVVAGPRAVQPHFERYAMWTIVPIALVVSRGVVWWLRQAFRYRAFAFATATIVACGLLISFERLYVHEFEASGGNSHLAFRTEEMDPREQALRQIISGTSGSKNTVIVSESWWARLPITYLASASKGVRVISSREFDANPTAFTGDDLWFVETAGSDEELALNARLATGDLGKDRHVKTDRAGRPVVVMHRVPSFELHRQ